MASSPLTLKQIPDKAYLDANNRQTYLGNEFSFPIAAFNLSGTSETPIFLLRNTLVAGSTNAKSIFYKLRRYTSDLQQVLLKLYINPTVTSTGTASVPVNLRPAYGTVSIAKAYTNGHFTVSANGTLSSIVGCPSNYYINADGDLMVILDPGTSVLITGTAQVANTNLSMTSEWYEL